MSAKRNFAILVLCLFVLTVIPIICFDAVSDPFESPNKAVLNANYKQYEPELVVSGSGATANIHIVWTDFQYGVGNSDISYARSTNGGSSFITKRINTGDIIDNSTSETSPDIAISGTYVYVVWKDMSQGTTS